jgi:DNA-binding IclR family transcriptional regulator
MSGGGRDTLRTRGDEATSARSASTGVHATLIVLDAIAGAGRPMHLSELAHELPVAKSTIHRVCAVLVERGWLVRQESWRVCPRHPRAAAGSRADDLPIVTAFRTVAAEYLTRHDEMLALAVLDGGESLYIAIEETSQPVRLVTHVGSRRPPTPRRAGASCWPACRRRRSTRCSRARLS